MRVLKIPPAELDPTHCPQASTVAVGGTHEPEPPWNLGLLTSAALPEGGRSSA
jgi:hypothetical protein